MNKKSMRVPDYLSPMLKTIHRIQRYTYGKSQNTGGVITSFGPRGRFAGGAIATAAQPASKVPM